ncbi:head-tail connector protein [Roseitranquillus sediminis]|uniref:head-tail connector protein n=1 Tax=Roseitranquillus sediminis TaxID=2809051 RepID=UPI0029C9B71F|nr:head-tail connector protein [Roseitranquillus sediminis]
MLSETTWVPAEALPIQSFREHLRLGTGFADDYVQDGVLDDALRAAIAAVEGRTGKALLIRSFKWTVSAWRDLARHTLPVAPVVQVCQLAIVDRTGQVHVVDPSRYVLERDVHRPRVASTSLFLPSIPVGGRAEIDFDAGYATSWNELPADLTRAVFLLAAHYYENRGQGSASAGPMPYGVTSLLDRYRNVRLFGGA